MRRSTYYIGMNMLFVLLAFTLFAFSFTHRKSFANTENLTAQTVQKLWLTDLAIFTEATYTRSLALADMNTPFQDSPMSFEHFPTGSLVQPPLHLVNSNAKKH